MNFLGHLYFSDNDPALMYANLFGDFMKGTDLEQYPYSIKKGIILHRAIDQYIDHHPDVVALMQHLYPVLPKVTGIAIDLYFDHILAQNWEQYHPISLRKFLDNFYSYSIDQESAYPDHYKNFIQLLKKNDWISHYSEREGLAKMCNGVSQRLSFENALTIAPTIFDLNKEVITETFHLYMKTAIPHFAEVRATL
jgi:acyl carrier protein phosphodiesterase